MTLLLTALRKYWPALVAIALFLSLWAWHVHAVESEGARRYEMGVQFQKEAQAKADNKALSDALAKSAALAQQAQESANETATVKNDFAAFRAGADVRERKLYNATADAVRQRIASAATEADRRKLAETLAGLLSRFDSLAERAEGIGRVCTAEVRERDNYIEALTH